MLLNNIKEKLPRIQNAWQKHRDTLLGDLHIFSSLIKGLSAFFDKDPLKNDFVPDYALIDEATAVNTRCKILVISEFT